ncbi:MAG: hypothetical protein IT376_06735 [Polyangiaceae bacterium]|nr:hypothetical protein [Polyangiaceae bacterium]
MKSSPWSLVALVVVWSCGGEESASGAGNGGAGAADSGLGDAAGGAAGAAGASGAAGVELGATCSVDTDCGSLRCYGPEVQDPVFRGGPAHGYCSEPCEEDADCAAIVPGALCARNVSLGAQGRCLLGCERTPGSWYEALPEGKCQGRNDVVCSAGNDRPGAAYFEPSEFACVPWCGSDADCPAPLLCGPLDGTCKETLPDPTSRLPVGSACDPAAPNRCLGLCLDFSSLAQPGTGPAGMCSRPCAIGSPETTTQCGGPDSGLCGYFYPSVRGPGDASFCMPACDTHADCLPELGMYCGGLDPAPTTRGFCYTPDDCASAACAQPNRTCLDTPMGKRCIDTRYGIVSAGGAGGSGGAAGAAGAAGAGS